MHRAIFLSKSTLIWGFSVNQRRSAAFTRGYAPIVKADLPQCGERLLLRRGMMDM